MSTSTKPPTRIYASVKEAGEMVGLSTSVVRLLCHDGQVESHFIGTRRLVRLSSLLAYIEAQPSVLP